MARGRRWVGGIGSGRTGGGGVGGVASWSHRAQRGFWVKAPHRCGSFGRVRRGVGRRRFVLTQSTERLVRQAAKRLRFFGTGAPGFERLELAGPLWGHPALAR